MKKRSLVIIFLMVFSLSLQNTCPYGMAGKTGFASHHINHCPLKENQSPAKKRSQHSKGSQQHTGQTYTFTASALLSVSEPVGEDRLLYGSAFIYISIPPEPLLKPPRLHA
jgi:hypothetical protein